MIELGALSLKLSHPYVWVSVTVCVCACVKHVFVCSCIFTYVCVCVCVYICACASVELYLCICSVAPDLCLLLSQFQWPLPHSGQWWCSWPSLQWTSLSVVTVPIRNNTATAHINWSLSVGMYSPKAHKTMVCCAHLYTSMTASMTECLISIAIHVKRRSYSIVHTVHLPV